MTRYNPPMTITTQSKENAMTTLMIHSDATGRTEACTVNQGVLGSDGNRYGAFADIDALLMGIDVLDPTPMSEEGLSEQILREFMGTGRVQDYKYADERQLREDERLSRLEQMISIADDCERDGLSIVDALPTPMHI